MIIDVRLNLSLLFNVRYKKQIEDAEEIAALNLAKFRKSQQQLEEADERTGAAEAQINRIRQERGASMLVRREGGGEGEERRRKIRRRRREKEL